MDNTLWPLLIILLLAICYVSTDNNNNKSNLNNNGGMLICLLLIGIVIYFLISNLNKTSENFVNNYSILNQIKECPSLNKKKLSFPLVSDIVIHSPIGSPHQLTEDLAGKNYPSVDGQQSSPRHLFTFAKNQCHLDCCPGTYSCDKGCICTTEQQERLLQSRGGNKSN